MLTDVIRRGAVSGVKGELIGPIQIGNSNNAAATALNPQKKLIVVRMEFYGLCIGRGPHRQQ